jgi:hypothetical protein
MVRVRQKTPGRLGKPFPKQRTPGVRKSHAAEPEIKSVEELQVEITELLNQAEQLMMKQPRPPFRMASAWDYPPLEEVMKQYKNSCWKLEQQLDPGPHDYTKSDEPSKFDEWLDATFRDPAGAVPRWTRRGSFIVWLDYLPMMITWTGLMQPDLTAVAVDPTQYFIRSPQETGRPKDVERARQLPSPGYLGLGSWQPIAPKWMSVFDMVCANILAVGKNLVLRPLTEQGKQNVRDTLASEPWIAEALKRGPEHRVQLPRHLHALPQSLFD